MSREGSPCAAPPPEEELPPPLAPPIPEAEARGLEVRYEFAEEVE